MKNGDALAIFSLVKPSAALLPSYIAALRAGWSPNNLRAEATIRAHLAAIETGAAAFLATLEDPEGRNPPVILPDGSTVPRLPSITRWATDGTFCGAISLRWQTGHAALPPYVLGHIGYSIVPEKRGAGCATQALRALLPEARAIGLAFVELTTEPDNIASQRVILANGGRLVERFTKPVAYGGGDAWRYRIDLTRHAS